MEAGLMKKVLSVNRSWTSDSYFSLRKPIHWGQSGGKSCRKCTGGMSGYRNKGAQISCFVPGAEYPSYATASSCAEHRLYWREMNLRKANKKGIAVVNSRTY